MSGIALITGGARSGKSRYALERASAYARKTFIATAVVTDEEMRERVRVHRRERGDSYTTIEEPVDLAGALGRVPDGCGVAIIDCLTVWLATLMHRGGTDAGMPRVESFIAALRRAPFDVLIVTNEVGMGIVPVAELGRAFRDRAGWLNQEVARLADEVVLLVSGIPVMIKGGSQP